MSGFDRGLLEAKERNELALIAETLGKKPPSRARKAVIIDLILELTGVTAEEAKGDEPAASLFGAEPDSGDAGDRGDTGAAKGAAAEAAHAEVQPASAPAESKPEVSKADGQDGGAAPEAPARRGRGRSQGNDDQSTTSAPAQGGRDSQNDQGGQPNQPNQKSQSNQKGSGSQGNQASQKGGSAPANQNGQGNQSGQGGQGGQKGNQNQGNQNQGNQNQGNQNQGNQNQGNQNQGNQNDSPGDDDGDDGNRRRRRRGRGRDNQPEAFEGEPVEVEGLLDLRDDGYGFLRVNGYLPSSDDVYVSVKQVRQFGLRKGDRIKGKSRPASRNEKNPALLQIDGVNAANPETSRDRRRFEDLTPLFPDERLTLEMTGAAASVTTRAIDLVSPIGKGQRGLIVAPPKAGKTTVMKEIARAIETNSPDVDLIVLLIDERPEEVTDMKRWLNDGEVAASTFDRPAEEHVQVAELVLERAKRMVEGGRDVVIILDGITRLARAYNMAVAPSGRTMSGGIDAAAIYPPKRFFGAARNAEEGGSLTILATALVETGSKMDEHIFEEFKGTGNMELRLSRRLAERRIFPAIDADASSTRHEELLFERRQVAQVDTLRKVLGAVKDEAAKAGDVDPQVKVIELLLDRLKSFKTNKAFLDEVGKAAADAR